MEELMTDLYVGLDISKGYLDAVAVAETGVEVFSGRFDDTVAGHDALTGVLLETVSAAVHPPRVRIGMESSGGYERNWLRWARQREREWTNRYPVTVYELNPLAVKRFLARELHRTKTDRNSALGIAQYLAVGVGRCVVGHEQEHEGAVVMYRHILSMIKHSAAGKIRLQALLTRVQPELVQYCRQTIPGWLLSLLKRYPTAPQLARARPATLARIPYLGIDRARSIVEAAKTTVASLTDAEARTCVALMSSELEREEKSIQTQKKRLIASLAGDPDVRLLESIPGIGAWSAVCLRLEIGSIERFHSSAALVSYTGLDPVVMQSGDTTRHRGISKRGKSRLRAILFPCAQVAIRHNPVVAALFKRLVSRGKKPIVAVVASMRKLVELVYTCWISQRPFDAARWRLHIERARLAEERTRKRELPVCASPSNDSASILSLAAPISRREAKKRKATSVPQWSLNRRMRGLGAASRGYSAGGAT
jgi:transposase